MSGPSTSSKASSAINYYVVAKNLHDKTVKSVRSKDLFVLLGNKEYAPFMPSSLTDFRKDTEYARIENNMMIKYCILGMANSKEEVNKLLHPKTGRLINPKTGPVLETKLPLSTYTLSSHAENQTRKQDKDAFKRTEVSLEMCIIEKTKPKSDSTPKKSSASKMTGDHSSQQLASSQTVPQVPETCGKCGVLEGVIQQQSKEIEALTAALHAVKQDDNQHHAQLMSCMEKMSHTIDDVHQAVTILSENNNHIRKKRRSVISADVTLDTLTDATDPEKHNDQVPEGKVFVGSGLSVPREALKKIDMEVFKPTLRINKLCELFWAEKVPDMSLSGIVSGDDKAVTQIPVVQTVAMRNILNLMSWDDLKDGEEGYFVTDVDVKDQIRRYTSRRRSKAAVAAGKPLPGKRRKGQGDKDPKKKRKEKRTAEERETDSEEDPEKSGIQNTGGDVQEDTASKSNKISKYIKTIPRGETVDKLGECNDETQQKDSTKDTNEDSSTSDVEIDLPEQEEGEVNTAADLFDGMDTETPDLSQFRNGQQW